MTTLTRQDSPIVAGSASAPAAVRLEQLVKRFPGEVARRDARAGSLSTTSGDVVAVDGINLGRCRASNERRVGQALEMVRLTAQRISGAETTAARL